MKKGLSNILMASLITASAVVSTPAMAQRYINNPVSQYYRDGYLWNPALAGQEKVPDCMDY
jgi:hypothetical protein